MFKLTGMFVYLFAYSGDIVVFFCSDKVLSFTVIWFLLWGYSSLLRLIKLKWGFLFGMFSQNSEQQALFLGFIDVYGVLPFG